MTSTATNTDTPPVAVLTDQQRARIVDRLLGEIMAGEVDKGTALLCLQVLGLTADGDAMSHGLAAKYMADGLTDGSISVNDVEPGFTVDRDTAREVLVAEYQREIDESVAALATVRVSP